jgi:hypothetical protein
MDGSSAHSKRMVDSRDAMTTRQAKLVTFVISLMTNVTKRRGPKWGHVIDVDDRLGPRHHPA